MKHGESHDKEKNMDSSCYVDYKDTYGYHTVGTIGHPGTPSI